MAEFHVRQDLTDLVAYPTFPFEPPVVPRDLAEQAPELVRPGESGPEDCDVCQAPDEDYLWTDRYWRLRLHQPSSLPGTVVLYSRDHKDSLIALPDEVTATFGPLCVRIERAILTLGTIGRVHLYRSGDGHAHFHLWFYPRPLGAQQFRGVFLSTWAAILDPWPEPDVIAAGEIIARNLADPT